MGHPVFEKYFLIHQKRQKSKLRKLSRHNDVTEQRSRLTENLLEPSPGEVISPTASSLNAIHIDFSRTFSKRRNIYT